MKKKLMFVTVALASLTACFQHTYTLEKGAFTNGSPKYSKWAHHFVYGLFGKGEVDIQRICPSGNAVIEDYHSFFNMIIGALLGSIWWPTTVDVYCDDRTAKITLTPEQLRAMGRSAEFEQWVAQLAPEKMNELVAARGPAAQAPVCLAPVASMPQY